MSPIMQSSLDWCAISNGATGCSLGLSFMTSKYSNFSKSDSSTFLFIPTTLSNSIRSFFITLGFFSSSESVHSIDVAEVSIEPTNISCARKVSNKSNNMTSRCKKSLQEQIKQLVSKFVSVITWLQNFLF